MSAILSPLMYTAPFSMILFPAPSVTTVPLVISISASKKYTAEARRTQRNYKSQRPLRLCGDRFLSACGSQFCIDVANHLLVLDPPNLILLRVEFFNGLALLFNP